MFRIFCLTVTYVKILRLNLAYEYFNNLDSSLHTSKLFEVCISEGCLFYCVFPYIEFIETRHFGYWVCFHYQMTEENDS
jgi:hypothetical protein